MDNMSNDSLLSSSGRITKGKPKYVHPHPSSNSATTIPTKNAANTISLNDNDNTMINENKIRPVVVSNSAKVERVTVDVIIPVHNASSTILEAITSVQNQVFCHDVTVDHCPTVVKNRSAVVNDVTCHCFDGIELNVTICCHDDSSTDDSLILLRELQLAQQSAPAVAKTRSYNDSSYSQPNTVSRHKILVSHNLLNSPSRGAGYARNRAARLHDGKFVCLLDSDDVMYPTRIIEQVNYFRQEGKRYIGKKTKDDDKDVMDRILLGCHFDRLPLGSTWHYTHWANVLLLSSGDDSTANTEKTYSSRLMLERFREVTVLQPTWMLTRNRFEALGGYVTAPIEDEVSASLQPMIIKPSQQNIDIASSGGCTASALIQNIPYQLIRTDEDESTLRLAEDLRLFHSHLGTPCRVQQHFENKSKRHAATNSNGVIRMVRTYFCSGNVPNVRESPASHFTQPQLHSPQPNHGAINSTSQSNCHFTDKLANTTTIQQHDQESKEHSELRQQSASCPLKPATSPRYRPLVMYRHREEMSQSSQTPRKLLLKLRVKAFEDTIVRKSRNWLDGFVIWGAGRDGKDFIKAMDPKLHSCVKGFADVDPKKINSKYYVNRQLQLKIPIIHFSKLTREVHADVEGGCQKRKWNDGNINTQVRNDNISTTSTASTKYTSNDVVDYTKLPIVVCVAMYRTDGVLETNVSSVGRTEGIDLWHFS